MLFVVNKFNQRADLACSQHPGQCTGRLYKQQPPIRTPHHPTPRRHVPMLMGGKASPNVIVPLSKSLLSRVCSFRPNSEAGEEGYDSPFGEGAHLVFGACCQAFPMFSLGSRSCFLPPSKLRLISLLEHGTQSTSFPC